jgi:hypothetical protein
MGRGKEQNAVVRGWHLRALGTAHAVSKAKSAISLRIDSLHLAVSTRSENWVVGLSL